ncbi:hypothetical protein D3C87_2146590 [compost metagenome]
MSFLHTVDIKKPAHVSGFEREEKRLFFESSREVHFTVADEARAFCQFVAKPDNQEQRNPDIRRHHAAPVNGV